MEKKTNRIGGNIKRLREAKGLTQAQLAKTSGIDEKYLSALERGVRNPSLKTIEKLSEGLGSSEMELRMGGDQKDKDLLELFAEIEFVYEAAKATSIADRYEFMAALTRAVAAHKREPQRDR